jgi:hypothetical protein
MTGGKLATYQLRHDAAQYILTELADEGQVFQSA